MAIEFTKKGQIAYVALNRPKALNALDATMLQGLGNAWDTIAADDEIRVAILYSKVEGMFCSGMDLKSFIPVYTGARPPANEQEKWLVKDPYNLFNAMLRKRTWDKPVIVAVNGLCLTGGFEMVMGTDIRIAAEDAAFQMRESTYGIMPIGGSNIFLPRQIPVSIAKEILVCGQPFSAQRLLDCGFLNAVVPAAELMDKAEQYAQRICDNGPLAVQGILRCIRETADMEMDEAMNKEIEIGLPIFSSADAREGIAAFKEKRKPQYKGK
jgi:enoyl-CoA hydratase